jgi:sulfatase maturation enzyme AslB (radical SAM superfamily)
MTASLNLPDVLSTETDQGSVSIESGYFVFTMMPSLRCKLNCPHCYLSVDERRNSPILSLDDLSLACEKVRAYYASRPDLRRKIVLCYWYGGEPTDMGKPYFLEAMARMAQAFRPEDGYLLKHTVLSSLVAMSHDWFSVFHEHCDHMVQSSYDGLMRGKGYLKKWDRQVRAARADGLSVSTISVVNRALIDATPEATLDYLAELGITETSWLPFMWNLENDGDPYRKFAPSMHEWSDFMIRLTAHARARRSQGLYTPQIGQEWFVLSQSDRGAVANLPAQTLFLMPDGEFVLPDYQNGFQEFMQPFGNILSQSFEEVLQSPARKKYLRKQVLRNHNSDCLTCEHSDKCVMEFWKTNREGDDCFGGKRYVEWLIAHPDPRLTFEKSTMY